MAEPLTAAEVANRLAGLSGGGYGPEQLKEALDLVALYGQQRHDAAEQRWLARIKMLEARAEHALRVLAGLVGDTPAAPPLAQCTCAERSNPPSLVPSSHYVGCPFRQVLERERGGGVIAPSGIFSGGDK